jgi:hypothetical protein
MAKAKDEVTDVEAPAETGMQAQQMGALTEILGRLVTRTEAGPIPQVPLARAKIATPWNPKGDRVRPTLSRPTYLNGHRLREITLSNEEITLLNQLTPGRYRNRKWLVVDTDTDGQGSAVQVYLPNKTEADRLEMKSVAKDLADALRLIVAEAEARKTA